MDIHKQIEKLKADIERSLGQHGPLWNPSKCSNVIEVLAVTPKGFVTQRAGVKDEDYAKDHTVFWKLAASIWENNRRLGEPPTDSNHKVGVQKLWGWCVAALDILDGKGLSMAKMVRSLKDQNPKITFPQCVKRVNTALELQGRKATRGSIRNVFYEDKKPLKS